MDAYLLALAVVQRRPQKVDTLVVEIDVSEWFEVDDDFNDAS